MCNGKFSRQPPFLEYKNISGPDIVIGLAPDDVNWVGIKLANGQEGYAPVKDNVYSAVLPSHAADGTFVDIPGFGG